MKTCSTCNISKPLTEFSVSKAKKIGINYKCKECHKIYAKEWYIKNKDRHKQNTKHWDTQNRLRVQKYLYEYLSTHPCIDCGQSDILVLEFDHVGEKSLEISIMYARGYTIEVIQQEIEKCVVRCANCHRRKTSIENKCWKVNFASVV